ncbi:MAG TPA: RNA polymerase factor sigma-54 [Desulfobacterales bacterium]|nr:RNA polymerase factor sigma-54 [Desulfobacterales bacterium]
MALELKQSLSLSQQLIMTPQLQQAIKLLQLSRLELLETIHQELETNPVLEDQSLGELEQDSPEPDEKEDGELSSEIPEVTVEIPPQDQVDWESYFSEYNTGWAETQHEEREIPQFDNIVSSKTNLASHLTWQLNMSHLDEAQRELGNYIIGNINEDGYLEVSVEELAKSSGHSVEEVEEVLKFIQEFDPVGVGARDTRECLLIQIKFQNLRGTLVEKLVQDHLQDLEHKRYDKIAKALNVDMEEIQRAVSIIQALEPKPGRSYSADETIYISPDIYVFKVGDDYEIMLNEDGLPKLRINPYYKDVLTRQKAVPESVRTYIQDKLKSAAWLIRSIHQRQRTIYKVTESIVKFQREFLDKGITHLKPLVLRDVAEDIQMHESTISRVTTNKYLYTPQGLFELKFFFNSAISSMDGGTVASESVKEHIRNIIKMENKAKPYSDQEIAEILKKMNINVARRTVAKYRETMGILPSRKRKKLF